MVLLKESNWELDHNKTFLYKTFYINIQEPKKKNKKKNVMARVFRHTREKVVKKNKTKQNIASIKNWHHLLYYIGKKTVTGNWYFQPFLCHWVLNSTVLSVVFASLHLLAAVCSWAFSVNERNRLGCFRNQRERTQDSCKTIIIIF